MTPPVPRVPRRRWACAGAVALALVGTGVVTTARAASPDPSTPETSRPVITAPPPDPSAAFRPPSIEWDIDALGDGVDEGHLAVPIDYADPLAGSFTLYLARHRATGDRVGSLLVNRGGPGFAESRFRRATPTQVYDEPLLEAFDIVGWDPRGRGSARRRSTASTTTTTT